MMIIKLSFLILVTMSDVSQDPRKILSLTRDILHLREENDKLKRKRNNEEKIIRECTHNYKTVYPNRHEQNMAELELEHGNDHVAKDIEILKMQFVYFIPSFLYSNPKIAIQFLYECLF